jgi:nucleoid DNA-binding protein
LPVRQLCRGVGDLAGLTDATGRRALDALVTVIRGHVANGITVRLPGLGAFRPRVSVARIGLNPRTGEPVAIAASVKLTFKSVKKNRTETAQPED